MPLPAAAETNDDRAAGAVGTYIQRETEIGRAVQILVIAGGVWFFAGFVVYWLVTGSWTIGVGGRISNLGGLLWIGPLIVGVALILIGPHGKLRTLWKPRLRLQVDRVGLAWEAEGPDGREAGSVAWSDVDRLRPRFWSTRGSLSVECQLLGPRGTVLATLPERWSRVDGRGRGEHRLTQIAVAVRPDRYRLRKRVLASEAVLIDEMSRIPAT